jgi:hypothetical protein
MDKPSFSSSQNCKCRRCESQLITHAIKKLYIIQKKEEVSVIKMERGFFAKWKRKKKRLYVDGPEIRNERWKPIEKAVAAQPNNFYFFLLSESKEKHSP